MNYTYSYTEPAGDDVDVYIVDSGVYTGNIEFEGHMTFSWAAPDYEMVDGNGHGTHCAGNAAGNLRSR